MDLGIEMYCDSAAALGITNEQESAKAFWKRLRSKWPAGKRTGEMGLLKDHLRCISEREWMWWRRLLNLAYEITTECPFERWKYTELISLQKEIGNDDTAKQRPIQLMDCMANTWNAAGIKNSTAEEKANNSNRTCK